MVRYTINMDSPTILELSRLVLMLRQAGYVRMSKSLIMKASAWYILQQFEKGGLNKVESMIGKFMQEHSEKRTQSDASE